jgi:SAM-dependent methyltransferase
MRVTPSEPSQDRTSIAKNSQFFAGNTDYATRVSALETYENIRRAIDPQIAGVHDLLDVGNGGVFDYDTSLVERIVGVDLFLQDTPAGLPENVTLRYGDALALTEPDAAYDCVLENSVFHHLIGSDTQSTLANIRQAIDEAYRVLKPGGRFVVMESCVSVLAFAIERRLFYAVRQLARTPLMRHPATLQVPPEMIGSMIEGRFGNVAVAPIPVGRWILQFGRRWPSALTPARPYLITATRT